MALAALFTDLKQSLHENPISKLQPHLPTEAAAVLRDLKFKAFIVDHGVRAESASEAKSVSSVLEQRGNEYSFP
jgi:tRNA(Ile)-lysidine synthase